MKQRRNREISRLAYLILKDAGICVRCLANWTHKAALCSECKTYWRRKGKRALFLVKKEGA